MPIAPGNAPKVVTPGPIAAPPVRVANVSVHHAVLAVARACLPVREATPNWGRFVQAIIDSAGGTSPEPWCASFVYYCGSRVLGRGWPLPMTRSCDVLLEYARSNNMLFDQALAGDVFLVMRSEHDAIHTGFVDALRPDLGLQAFATLEGNTNTDGSANGIGVFSNVRGTTARTAYEFIRWAL
jgi:hypothetical protein